jgi:Xaa-Pro aminopeptidase
VQKAQAAGVARLAAGTLCAEADSAALDVLRDAGFGAYIRHRLGHGLGLENHEAPWLEAGDPTPLRAGMVVSAEPGLYWPGRGGWRISDTLIVGRGGAEAVTTYPRGLDAAVLTGVV